LKGEDQKGDSFEVPNSRLQVGWGPLPDRDVGEIWRTLLPVHSATTRAASCRLTVPCWRAGGHP